MTKKDYVLIAGVLNSFYTREYEGEPVSTGSIAAEIGAALCGRLKMDNGRFDSERFMAAVRKE
jgi:hypothetical protein